ncbi:MAG: hypothetical protein WD154_05765 [Nitrosopumilaceae archaeon]
MLTTLDTIKQHRFLVSTLIATGFGILLFNFVNDQDALLFSDLLFVFTSGSVAVLSVIVAIRNRLEGYHGKAWMLFSFAVICWFIAEVIWTAYQQVYKIDPWPSEADFFWLAGYPLFFGFLMYYQRPVYKSITKKMVISSTLISISILVLLLYISYDENLRLNEFEHILGLSYPILDAFVLIPLLIGVFLFFKGKVNFMWILMSLGMISFIVSDNWFFLTDLNESYYPGHPLDLLYIWGYVLFSFGVYNNMKIFHTK